MSLSKEGDMPIERQLLENGRVLLYKFSDPWTVNDLMVESADNDALFDQSDKLIHVIGDMSGSSLVPAGVLRLRTLAIVLHKNAGSGAIIGTNVFMKAFGDLFGRLTGNNRVIYVDTTEEAWAHIRGKMTEEDRPDSR